MYDIERHILTNSEKSGHGMNTGSKDILNSSVEIDGGCIERKEIDMEEVYCAHSTQKQSTSEDNDDSQDNEEREDKIQVGDNGNQSEIDEKKRDMPIEETPDTPVNIPIEETLKVNHGLQTMTLLKKFQITLSQPIVSIVSTQNNIVSTEHNRENRELGKNKENKENDRERENDREGTGSYDMSIDKNRENNDVNNRLNDGRLGRGEFRDREDSVDKEGKKPSEGNKTSEGKKQLEGNKKSEGNKQFEGNKQLEGKKREENIPEGNTTRYYYIDTDYKDRDCIDRDCIDIHCRGEQCRGVDCTNKDMKMDSHCRDIDEDIDSDYRNTDITDSDCRDIDQVIDSEYRGITDSDCRDIDVDTHTNITDSDCRDIDCMMHSDQPSHITQILLKNPLDNSQTPLRRHTQPNIQPNIQTNIQQKIQQKIQHKTKDTGESKTSENEPKPLENRNCVGEETPTPTSPFQTPNFTLGKEGMYTGGVSGSTEMSISPISPITSLTTGSLGMGSPTIISDLSTLPISPVGCLTKENESDEKGRDNMLKNTKIEEERREVRINMCFGEEKGVKGEIKSVETVSGDVRIEILTENTSSKEGKHQQSIEDRSEVKDTSEVKGEGSERKVGRERGGEGERDSGKENPQTSSAGWVWNLYNRLVCCGRRRANDRDASLDTYSQYIETDPTRTPSSLSSSPTLSLTVTLSQSPEDGGRGESEEEKAQRESEEREKREIEREIYRRGGDMWLPHQNTRGGRKMRVSSSSQSPSLPQSSQLTQSPSLTVHPPVPIRPHKSLKDRSLKDRSLKDTGISLKDRSLKDKSLKAGLKEGGRDRQGQTERKRDVRDARVSESVEERLRRETQRSETHQSNSHHSAQANSVPPPPPLPPSFDFLEPTFKPPYPSNLSPI